MEVQETFHVIVVGLNFPNWVTKLKVAMILDLEKVVMPLSLVLFLARKRKVFHEGKKVLFMCQVKGTVCLHVFYTYVFVYNVVKS